MIFNSEKTVKNGLLVQLLHILITPALLLLSQGARHRHTPHGIGEDLVSVYRIQLAQ